MKKKLKGAMTFYQIKQNSSIMSRRRPQKKRTANDFLAMLSEVVVQEDEKEKNDNDNDLPNSSSISQTLDLTKNLPELKIEGTPILFNEWFNVCDKKFYLDKPELEKYKYEYNKNEFALALSTSNSIPSGPIELHKHLLTDYNINMLKDDNLAPSIFDYRDFLFVGDQNKRFRQLAALHVVNHIYRDFEAKDNRQSASVKDSNFTPTIILVICPYKKQAYEFISEIIKCLPEKVLVKKGEEEENKEEEDEETGNDQIKSSQPQNSQQKATDDDIEYVEKKFQIEKYDELQGYDVESIPDHFTRTRDQSWLEIFGGNTESDFKTGIRFFPKKAKVSLFQGISKSQLVIASPLALSLFEQRNFMSSIEVLVLDSIDVLLMQHADRLAQVVVGLNTLPKTVDQTDWSRLRQYCSDNNHKKMRQSIGYGRILTPEIMNIYKKTFENIRGELIVRPLKYPQVLLPKEGAERVFKKMSFAKNFENSGLSNVEQIGDIVFKTFNDIIFPKIKEWRSESESDAKRTIIYFVSSYRFLQARKKLEDDFVNYLELSDESTSTDMTNMKKAFKKDPNSVMLLTERHYFHFMPDLNPGRVIFLQPPSYPLFAEKLAKNCSTTIYFTEFDELALERIAGSDYLEKIISSDLYSY